MKQVIIIAIFLFAVSPMRVSAQEKDYQELIKYFTVFKVAEDGDPEFSRSRFVRKYLHRIIDTDSIYSFFQADIFKPYRVRIIVDDHPILKDTVIKYLRTDHYYILDVLSQMYDIRSTGKRVIPRDILREMVYAVIDSTTQYTQPIYNWDVSRMGERYFAKTTMFKTISLLSNYAVKEDESKRKWTNKTYECYLRLHGKLMGPAFSLKMSLPIFDEEYKYALLFFVDGQRGEHSFAIFERQSGDWSPVVVTWGKDINLYSNDFKNY